ncbi:MAG TPA: Ig-like domain repeat protein [Terracidiphilus sp.]|nr:Ig-like domain repeat protein [Terracidiphilus sp.]
MAIESALLVRRVARFTCLVLGIGLLCSGVTRAQLPVKAPAVTAGSVVPFGHGSTGAWSQIYSMKFAPSGDLVFMDSAISNIYQLAPGASTPTLIIGPAPSGTASNCSTLEASGSYWNASIAFDAQNNMYVTDRYGSAVHFCRVPYNATSKTWVFSAAANWTKSPTVTANGVQTAIAPQDLTVGDDGTFYVSWSNTGEIDKFTVDASGNTSSVTQMVTGLQTTVTNVAVDHAGNLFFLENVYGQAGTHVTGIREIPANTTLPLTGDGTGNLESGFPRIDPEAEGLNGIKGMTFDAAGNLYLSLADNSSYGGNVSGVLMVANEGTAKNPNLVWTDNLMISPVYAGFPVAIDPRGYIWIPTGGGGNNWAAPGYNAPACDTSSSASTNATCTSSSVVQWAMGSADLGASPVGKAGNTQDIFFDWSQSFTPAGISLTASSKNFTLLATNPSANPNANPPVLPCTAGTNYPGFSGQETSPTQYSWCIASVQLNAQAVGSVGGELQLLDSSNNAIPGSNVYLHGIGQGANVSVLSPAAQQATASGLSKPLQVAADAWGNSYVADSALKGIEYYPAGSASVVGSTIGTGFSAPTGVAVDGAGDLYIGDSGKVIEIPYINGALATKQQTTIATGLGSHLNLATDGVGGVYIADADKAQVLKVSNPGAGLILEKEPLLALQASAAWTAPSAIATDTVGNIYVADGSNLWQITPMGGAAELTSSLSAPVTGLAVDSSGSVFVAEATGLVWIPFDSTTGGLNVNGAVTVAATLGASSSVPVSVALDGMANAFVTYGSGAAAGLSQLGVGGAIDWGQIVPFLETDQEAQVFNLGNAPLTFAAFSGDTFTGANAADYSIGTPVDTPACDPANPIPAGSSCFFDVALTPSAAGTSSASVGVQTSAVNASSVTIALAANAVPDNRAPTTTSLAITPPTGAVYPGTESIAVTVSSSGGTPTGSVVVTVSGQAKQTQSLVNGVATFSYTNLLGGTYNVSADYGGDGTAGSAPYPSCATGTSCFAVSAAKSDFTINPATPKVSVGAPTGSAKNVTVWAGNTYLSVATANTITATVASSVGTPTGSVSFESNGKPVDATQVSIPLDANGNAVFSTANLPVGVYNLAVVYNGDTNYSVVSVPIPAFQVIVPSVQITATPNTTSITAGTPDQVMLTLKPLVGFTQQVNVQCVAATLPAYSECTFDNPEIGVGEASDPTAPTTIVVTISTNIPVNGVTSSIRNGPAPWSLAAFLGLGLAGLVAGRRRFSRMLMLVFLGLMLSGAFLSFTACTNASYSTPPPAPKVTTPSGNFAIQIITVNPANGQQNSLTTPLFALQATVQ